MSRVINKLTRETEILNQCGAAISRRRGDYEWARKWLEWARQDRANLKRWGWKLP